MSGSKRPRRGRARAREEARRRAHDVLTLRPDAFPGLEVRARALPRHRIEPLARRAFGDTLTGAEHEAALVELVEAFAAALTWWNLEERDGEDVVPVPAARDAVLIYPDRMFVLHLAILWGRAAMAHAGMAPRGAIS